MGSDAELVAAVLAGDREAFAGLVQRYERAVRATALAVVRDHHVAQDIAQEAFLAAYTKLGGLRNGATFGPWLLQIVRRRAVEVTRRRSYGRALQDEDIEIPAPSDGQLKEDSRRLLSAVMRLPERERALVMLRYFDGQDVADIAQATGRPVGTVTGLLSRARDRLRRWLKESES